jgi:DNA-binding MarR family transcriptional regulator
MYDWRVMPYNTPPEPGAKPDATPAPEPCASSGSAQPADPAPVFYDARTYQPDDSLGYLMRRILTLFRQEVEHDLEPSGLTNAQWAPLFKLHNGCASTVAELARECDHDAGATTRLLDRLEAKGLCQRVRSQEDRRVVHIELTPSGKLAAQEIPAVLSKVQNAYLAGFSREEWQTLKSYLRRILDTAQSLQAKKENHDE